MAPPRGSLLQVCLDRAPYREIGAKRCFIPELPMGWKSVSIPFLRSLENRTHHLVNGIHFNVFADRAVVRDAGPQDAGLML